MMLSTTQWLLLLIVVLLCLLLASVWNQHQWPTIGLILIAAALGAYAGWLARQWE